MIAQNLELVKERMERAAVAVGRDPKEVTLVAVSKTIPVQIVSQAVQAGIQHLGENRAQELHEKKMQLNAPLFWHFIGQLQRNKIKYIIDDVYMVQSVDRASIADALEVHCEQADRNLDVLLQVSMDELSYRGGVQPQELEALAAHCAGLDRLRVRGLMCIAPLGLDELGLHHCFASVRKLFDRLNSTMFQNEWTTLSMGMSSDFEIAIQEGATLVRVGSAIFGARA